MFQKKVHLQTYAQMISAHESPENTHDRRRLPKATKAQIKANKKARNQKYRRKGVPAWGCHRKPWTAKEEWLVFHHNGFSDFDLSKVLGRSRTCIQVRRSKLNKLKK